MLLVLLVGVSVFTAWCRSYFLLRAASVVRDALQFARACMTTLLSKLSAVVGHLCRKVLGGFVEN